MPQILFAGRFAAVIAALVYCEAAGHAVAAEHAGAVQRASAAGHRNAVADAPQCAPTPRDCAALGLAAMGGRDRIEAVQSLRLEGIQHLMLVEQSYRQEPFITAYARTKEEIDFGAQRLVLQTHLTWPESDPGQSDSDSTLVVGPEGAVYRNEKSDSPASRSTLEAARHALALGPLRLLLTASNAPDLHFEKPQRVRGTLHPVLAFNRQGRAVHLLINPFNHLPDAVESVAVFYDHWYQFGDVRQRIYWDNWQTFHGIRYPTNEVEERNGVLWESRQVLRLDLNPAIEAAEFKLDAGAAQKGLQSKGWESPFKSEKGATLAPGITLFPGSWNATLVKQDDGVVLLESPLSGTYIGGVIEKAKAENPGQPLKAVLSTSDSWPHVGGVRQVVALGLPVYILDLNKPLLERLVAAPHHLNPDLLTRAPHRPNWRIVSQKVQVGSGANRMELYPLRGPSTERQYMVYFPEHHLLYASDTLALNEDGSLYDPELMREVMEAVKREGLDVSTVFAMHQGPLPWAQVAALVEKALT
jgi:glyoxylase-like metal-dependent hydrolase (beta-lactamase superfamily II)